MRRSRPLKRRGPKLEPRPRILIVCEGKKTEPLYFNQVRIDELVGLVDIVLEKAAGVPKTLVETAVELKRSAERRAVQTADGSYRYDEVWCVFDVDEHPRLQEAQQQARDNNIFVAMSNPCFELWFLLHFQDQTAYIHRKAAKGVCKRYMRGYEKVADYALLRERYADAVKRARALDERQRRNECDGENPSTWVYRLTERLHELGRSSQLERIRRNR